jgi:hypothetical protein
MSRKNLGAEGGTRTPTPLRVHGPEPCASANSATTALSNILQVAGHGSRESLVFQRRRSLSIAQRLTYTGVSLPRKGWLARTQ